MTMCRTLHRWDVLCRVVDHYGDAGVCLRLARRLAAHPGRMVRLWIDRPETALSLIDPPPGDAVQGWTDRSGVQMLALDGWRGFRDAGGEVSEDDRASGTGPADILPEVVIETFGGGLPVRLLDAMCAARAAGRPTPVWLNLEYLSAEAWVEGCHGLPSPRGGGLTRWFMFPGFSAGTAGLLGPQTPAPALPAHLAALARGTQGSPGTLVASVFCYRDSPLPDLLEAMQSGAHDMRLLIPAGMPGDLGGRVLGADPGATWHGGRLTLVRIPFVDQDTYDALLAACDFNLVRGEDSFVRGQWSARPLLWSAYRQAEAAHSAKVEAWLSRCAMPPAWAALTRWINGSPGQVDALWRAALAELGTARTWSAAWREQLSTLPRLEQALEAFALDRASTVESRA